MTQHREDRPALGPDELAAIAANVRGDVPHSGQLPEEMRETPVQEFDNTPLDQAVEQGLIDTDVDSPAALVEPENTDDTDEPATLSDDTNEVPRIKAEIATTAPAETPAEPAEEVKSKRGRKAAAAGTAAALVLGLGAYFATRGNDHSSEATDPNTQPTPTATTSESPSSPAQPSTSESATPSTNVLDSTVDGDIKPNRVRITAPIFEKMANAVGDHVSYESINRLVDAQALQELRNSDDPVVLNFLAEYVDNPNGMANLFNGDQSGAALLQSIYNNTVAFESQFYGNPQNFQGANTAKLIGELPYATHKDIEDAYFNGDVTPLFNKLFNANQANIYKVLKNEVAAGNDDFSLADNLSKWTLENQILPNYSELQPQVAQDYQSRMDALKKDPNTYMPPLDGNIKDAKVLYVSREIVGGDTGPVNDQPNGIVQAEITTMVAQVNGTLEVIALVPVPGHTGKAEGVQGVIVALAS